MAKKTATATLRVHAICPHCDSDISEITVESIAEGKDHYDNGHDRGTGGFKVNHCASCGKSFVIERDTVNDDLQHIALVLLGEADPHPELDDETLCEAVATTLNADGFTAEAQYTGGGIWCVSIAEPARPNASWLFGMSADDWGGTLMEADSYAAYEGPEDGGEMQLLHCVGVSSESQGVTPIAAAIATEIRTWRARKAA